ncbi:MAG TPA: Asp-tRNA(Asn)/Glu-tRNA(Gln) amidotransferase GatCAB subunit A [Chloroflexi bacterium]|jgi:aspartyl-tRNA(Asn)/glutamyl-tRNA(Gln) amidotransferase subunit A|nr:Asp-tRNA(Asn)/Glu-tRNA(Gln) amidotransferase GatCAB subunit A [Chloroflexota bacterium]
MQRDELNYLSIAEASDLLSRREISSVELTEAALRRVEECDGRLNAMLLLTSDLALLQARHADERLARGEFTPLCGIPMGLKDIFSTRSIPTTCGSRILESYVPQFNATAVDRLFDAGAVLIGKTNMDEFAMGSSTENSAFFPTRNPWDPERVPGGSSGGSAAAVASGEVVFAMGTDTGGSIRQPAALTGTVGLKPTYGRVSRYGLVAFGSSLDQPGPITRSVRDVAVVLGAIAGRDPRDSTSIDALVPDYVSGLTGDVRGLRLGVPNEYFAEGMSSEVRHALELAIGVYRDLGAALQPVSLPMTEHGLSTYYVISPAEAMANLARFDGVRYGLCERGADVWEMFSRTRETGFGSEVKRRILLGTYVLSAGYYDAYYVKAQRVRTLVRQDFEKVFETVDALITPTAPTPAFRLGEKVSDPLQMYLSDVYTVPASMAGVPAVSIPCGFAHDLPVGLQVIGPALGEQLVLRVAHAFEQSTDYHLARPPLREANTADVGSDS